jgi:hypothetical protein
MTDLGRRHLIGLLASTDLAASTGAARVQNLNTTHRGPEALRAFIQSTKPKRRDDDMPSLAGSDYSWFRAIALA